ncbi:MAG: sugar phosphate isomerase/epimerase [Acidobacteriota bacterium]
MTDQHSTRRELLGGALAAAALRGGSAMAAPPEDLRLGVASYSLRKLSRQQAIDGIKQLGVKYVCIKEFHLRYASTPEELTAGRKEFEDAGLTIVGGGSIDLKKDDDTDMKKYFDYARNCGMPLMVIAPTQETLPRIEKFVKQYNIKVAVHNHGPEDKFFPTAESALKAIQGMDPRVGLCVDVGHSTRAGADPVESIRRAGPRVLDVHIKDLRDLMKQRSDCPVGDGAMPIVAIFKELKKIGYKGCVNLEYEIDADNPLPGMAKSFAYMRGVLAGLRG